ncbi:MAG: GAF domain-containing protein, partial [Haloplanus sp.]
MDALRKIMMDRRHVVCAGERAEAETVTVTLADDDRIEVDTATTVEHALDLLSASTDCVVVAPPLPDADGLGVLRRVRERYPDLPFVLYPSDGSETLAREAFRTGVTDYVPQSGDDDPDRLVEAVVDAIDAEPQPAHTRCAERVVSLVRTIQSALVRARTGEEIDTSVCEAIVETIPYAFAWIGEYDEADGRVTPRASAGLEMGYLDAIDIATDGSRIGWGPTGRAIKRRTVQTVQDITSAPEYEPWREEALDRSYRSSAAIPLRHGEILYGVLNVYADRVEAFDDEERSLLGDLGETIGHAYHRVRMQERYESQYRQLFEEAPVMVALTRDGDDGPVIQDCNRRFATKLGWSRDELRDRPLSDM